MNLYYKNLNDLKRFYKFIRFERTVWIFKNIFKIIRVGEKNNKKLLYENYNSENSAARAAIFFFFPFKVAYKLSLAIVFIAQERNVSSVTACRLFLRTLDKNESLLRMKY